MPKTASCSGLAPGTREASLPSADRVDGLAATVMVVQLPRPLQYTPSSVNCTQLRYGGQYSDLTSSALAKRRANNFDIQLRTSTLTPALHCLSLTTTVSLSTSRCAERT